MASTSERWDHPLGCFPSHHRANGSPHAVVGAGSTLYRIRPPCPCQSMPHVPIASAQTGRLRSCIGIELPTGGSQSGMGDIVIKITSD